MLLEEALIDFVHPSDGAARMMDCSATWLMTLLGDRLKELSAEEENITSRLSDAEQRLSELPMAEQYKLSKKEYANLKEELNSLMNDSPAQQKRLFLSKLVKSITVHPDKLTVEYHPPIIPNKKKPHQKRRSFFRN